MSYKTNLHTTIVDNTTKKEIPVERARLKAQLDDFATFQWRGHDMFDDFGCFIINESKGSLKFYNGPGYTNQYAKTQFSSSINGLLGIDFKQQTIQMKIGMYWFTIEEYQEFLNEVSPYVINYLTFGYEKEYSYLVKMGKIADSPRHIVGKDKDGNCRYYTEMDLVWELLGDNCVRSNLPYEYKGVRLEGVQGSTCTWEFDKKHSDMKDDSLLDTPLLLELPVWFTKENANLKLVAKHNKVEQEINLFNINLQNLTYSDAVYSRPYRINENRLESFGYVYYDDENNYYHPTGKDKIIEIKHGAEEGNTETEDYKIEYEYDDEISIGTARITCKGVVTNVEMHETSNARVTHDGFTVILTWGEVTEGQFQTSLFWIDIFCQELDQNIPVLKAPIRYNSINYNYIIYAKDLSENRAEHHIMLMLTENDFNNAIICPAWDVVYTFEIPSDEVYSILDIINTGLWDQYSYEYTMFLKYDSETGLIYIQEGSRDSWHLLNFQTDNMQGNYLLKSGNVSKFKLPGKFSQPNLNTTEWKFILTVQNIDLNMGPDETYDTALTIYSRKNIV